MMTVRYRHEATGDYNNMRMIYIICKGLDYYIAFISALYGTDRETYNIEYSPLCRPRGSRVWLDRIIRFFSRLQTY
jgi:hypothetical protein